MRNPSNQKPVTLRNVTIPEDFRIACMLHNLTFTEVLQTFIDKVSVFASLGGEEQGPHTWAGTVVSEYTDDPEFKPRAEMTEPNRQRGVKYIRRLVRLIMAPDLSSPQKKKRARPIIKEWYQKINPDMTSPGQLHLSEGIILNPTENFCLQCEMFRMYPEDILQYFMEHVSMAKDSAVVGLHRKPDNPAMIFFILLTRGYFGRKDTLLPHKEIYHVYVPKLLKLNKVLFMERDPKNREEQYRELYRAWYQDLVNASKNKYLSWKLP